MIPGYHSLLMRFDSVDWYQPTGPTLLPQGKCVPKTHTFMIAQWNFYNERSSLHTCSLFKCQMPDPFVTLHLICIVGRRGSVVACVTYKCEIAGLISGWAELCSDVVLLGKALCPHMHSLDPEVSGYLVGQWRLVCWNSSVGRKWQPGCMLLQGIEMACEWTGLVTMG